MSVSCRFFFFFLDERLHLKLKILHFQIWKSGPFRNLVQTRRRQRLVRQQSATTLTIWFAAPTVVTESRRKPSGVLGPMSERRSGEGWPPVPTEGGDWYQWVGTDSSH